MLTECGGGGGVNLYMHNNLKVEGLFMKNYLNKKVEIREKVFGGVSSTNMPLNNGLNTIVGVITNIYDDKFIELDNKVLLAIDYIYKVEIVD